MSREVRRVPLDFDWPLNKVYEGYVMPEEIRGHHCPDCDNGSTAAGAWLESIAYLLLMLDDDLSAQQRGRPLHPWLEGMPLKPSQRPSADIRALGTGLAGRESGLFGHDAIDSWRTKQAIIKAAGLDEAWGVCTSCAGTAWAYDSDAQRAAADAWEATEPPQGEGWQVWETVSEGSPVTPVFATPEELAAHLSGKTFGSEFDNSLSFVTGVGWAPSGFAVGGKFTSSAEVASGQSKGLGS